ncbi:hypothetical protein COCNU_scaffold065343G000010 [Cocos nucifera]|nr:hypothetical protein [Cocos nucifera]
MPKKFYMFYSVAITLDVFMTGLALKPGVQMMSKIMMNVGSVPVLSIPGSAQSSITMLSGSFDKKVQSSSCSVLDLESKTMGSTFQHARFDESPHQEPTYNSYESNGTLSGKSIGSCTEKVINNFSQNPVFRNDEEMELNEVEPHNLSSIACNWHFWDKLSLAGNLRSESNMLQTFLKHQQVIEELMEENEKLCQILMVDLNVPPSKLQTNKESKIKTYYTCSDCFECQRRNRRRTR